MHVGVRIPPDQLASLDAVAVDQPEPTPGRREAVRRALLDYLRGKRYLPIAD